MDQNKTNKKALCLAYNDAATREIQIFHPWRYFVAGGETLRQIEQFIQDFSSVEQGYADLAKMAGAQSYNGNSFIFDFKREEAIGLSGTECVDYHLDGKEYPPHQGARILRIPDFVVTVGRAYGNFNPDVSTERGKKIRDACMAVKEKQEPSVRLAKWLGCYNVTVYSDPMYAGTRQQVNATATKVDNQWVVAVPVITEADDRFRPTGFTEKWVTPPDSAPLTVSAYFNLLEKENLLRNTPPAPKN